ncbi:MAG: hypothetical protein QJR03_02015 [Sphaerobacter sp.]|nr:hypothetical protein [Sphaerobacter sp.]
MTPGDALFVGAFIVLPIILIIWSLVTLRTIRRRRQWPAQPIERTGTAELPVVEEPPSRDWSAAIRPRRGEGRATAMTAAPATRPFWPPIYRGRARGVVRRLTPPAARWPRAHRRRPRDAEVGLGAARRR